MRVHLLSRQTSWYGQHTGYYEQLPRYLRPLLPDLRVTSPRKGLVERLVGKLYSTSRGWPPRNQNEAAAEWRFERALLAMGSEDVGHILSLEFHLSFLDRWPKAPENLMATIHYPASTWDAPKLANLGRLSSAIILYQSEIPFFESYVGRGRVHFVPHGVDTEFFCPDGKAPAHPRRLLVAGQFLRDFPMLGRVIARLHARVPELGFDIVVAEHARNSDGLIQLRDHPAVRWHQKISDEQLRELYRRSYLLLLPLIDSGANNAIVESLASGLPVVTTAVGGIADYGGGTLFPVFAPGDDRAMAEWVLELLEQPDRRDEISTACRQMAEAELNWPLIARRHAQIYRQLL